MLSFPQPSNKGLRRPWQPQVGCARAGRQLQPSACMFLGSQGLGSSVPGHRAWEKPLWLTRMGRASGVPAGGEVPLLPAS